MEKARLHAFVSGLVQGVFFRSTTRDVASRLGLKGFVRNLPDGRVEVVAEGDSDKLKELISFLKKGPPAARVEKVDVKWEKFEGEFDEFEIRY